jgi:hypothetical protein
VLNPLEAKGMVFNHEKVIHEQNIVLESWTDNPKQEGTLTPGLHRWPFHFILSNDLVETIECVKAKVSYYVSATIHKAGTIGMTKLRSRKDVLLLRTPDWSDNALVNNALPSNFIVSERKLDICDASICVEKAIASSGTQFPIVFKLSANQKNVFIESISVNLEEKRIFRLPEFKARRVDHFNFKVPLEGAECLNDPSLAETNGFVTQLDAKDIRRLLCVKNAHVPLDGGPFLYRIIFTLPTCDWLNHSSTYSEIDITHTLKIHIQLSSPRRDITDLHLESPLTILDCRLKEDFTALPTYKEALLADDGIDENDLVDKKPQDFFVCRSYLAFKKNAKCNRKQKFCTEENAPPSYDTI